MAPPVMMIGPSAPNGPPDPIEIADEMRLQNRQPRLHFAAVDQNGFERFRNAVSANAFRAVARHESDDQAAALPGPTPRTSPDGFPPARQGRCSLARNRRALVKNPIRRSSAHATNVLKIPMPIASNEIGMTRAVVVKSPSSSESFCVCLLTKPPFPADAAESDSSARASSGPERSSSVRCASASLRRIARPAGVSRTQTSRLSSVPGMPRDRARVLQPVDQFYRAVMLNE